MNKQDKIFVAGHRGLVGSAVVRRLQAAGYQNLILRTRQELDLQDQAAVVRFFEEERPRFVFVAAAKVGGILANSMYPADFIRDNLSIGLNIVESAYRAGVEKLLFLGSSCIYPKFAPQPLKEEYLLSGALEPTNEWYAVAKIAGIKLCQAYYQQYGARFISVMPTNLYGPGDNFDLETSHVLPALLRKFHEARERMASEVVLWGSGTPRREFMHVDDLADACVYLMNHYDSPEIINVGVGEDLSIRDLAEMIAREVGYTGGIVFDRTKPDGTPRKVMDVSRLEDLGWQAAIPLQEGIRQTYSWYLETVSGS